MTTPSSPSKGIGGHHRAFRGATDDWLTPSAIIKSLGPFDLDPCCPPNMPWPTAKRMFTCEDDGLEQEWSGRVWLNPPYGPATGNWLSRLALHGNGIALIFARTETAMFFEYVWGAANAVLFLEGRLHFHRVDGSRAKANAGGPSVLVAYGQECSGVLFRSTLAGYYVPLR